MTLHVDFDRFADEAKRYVKNPVAYLSRLENRTHATSADPAAGVLISASASITMEEAKAKLTAQGLEVAHGGWSQGMVGASDSLGELPYVAAIAYKSSDEMPGLWVDAFAEAPSAAVAIKALYDEFKETGEIAELTLEEFVRVASPNVTIVSPGDLERFLDAKSPCD